MNLPMQTTSYTLGFLGNIGWPEILIVGVIMLLLFGRRLPEMGRSLGQGIVEFKKGLKDVTDDIKNEVDNATNDSKSKDSGRFESAKPHEQSGGTSQGHTNPSEMKAQVEAPRTDA